MSAIPLCSFRAKGVYIEDENGNQYLDLLSGIGVNALGYGHPAIEKAIAEQSRKLIHTSNLFFHEGQAELAARLTEMTGMDRAFFCNSGTEAWEAALKLARAYAGMKREGGLNLGTKFLALEHSFHGRSMGSVSTTHKPKYREPFAPLIPGVDFIPFDDVAALREVFSTEYCAILIESIQGEGGIRPVSPEFLKEAYELTRATGALLIVDEIQAGFGRTGKWCAYQHYGVQPDVTTLAKPLAGGLPLGALLCTEAVSAAMHPGMHGTTFGGGPLACAVAIAVIDAMEKDHILEHVQNVGAYFKQRLDSIAADYACVAEVRGMGLMLALDLDSEDLAKTVAAEMMKRRILINRTSETVLRFLPPYILRRSMSTSRSTLFIRSLTRTNPRSRQQRSRIPLEADSMATKALLEEQPMTIPGDAAATLAGRDLCSIADLSMQETRGLIESRPPCQSRPFCLSPRTRREADGDVLREGVAGARASRSRLGSTRLGGSAIFVDQTQSPLGERESLADIARNVERWVSIIVLRTYSHETITEMADYARVPVINALSDLEHPCQAIGDWMSLEERFGTAKGLKFTYVGDGNNVCHSLMLTGAQLGAQVTVATPKNYGPKADILAQARGIANNSGGSIEVIQDPIAAVTGADAVYTDVCTSMGFEHEATKRAPLFKPYQVNELLMSHASPRAVFMHCLPAHRNAEVTDAVLDGPQSIVFEQAENRMHAQKSLLLMLLGAGASSPKPVAKA